MILEKAEPVIESFHENGAIRERTIRYEAFGRRREHVRKYNEKGVLFSTSFGPILGGAQE